MQLLLRISRLPHLFGFKETIRTEPVDGVYRRNSAAGSWREVFCHDRRKLSVSDLLVNNVLYSVPASQKILLFHYKHQPVNATGEIITVHCDSYAEHINVPCGHSSGFLSIKVGCKYIKWFIHTSDQEACQFKSYVYWTMHHLDSLIKIDQLDVTCVIISLFTAQHVLNVSTSIFRSLRLIVDLFHVLYCSGSMCVGVTLWFGWGGVVSLCRLKHGSSVCFLTDSYIRRQLLYLHLTST